MTKEEWKDLIERSKDNPEFGRMLINRNPPWIYHPSIQLDMERSIAWIPRSRFGSYDVGILDIWDARTQELKAPARDRGETYRRLLRSVDVFHDDWRYDLWRFNCQHFAHLIHSGECKSPQLEDFSLFLELGKTVGAVPEYWVVNKYAQEALQ